MNTLLTSLAFQLQDFAVRPYIFAALKPLDAAGDPLASKLTQSVRDSFTVITDSDVKHRINTIEEIRKHMNKSKEVVNIVDYGAHADPESGTTMHRSIGEVSLSSSKPYRWSLLLFQLIRHFKPQHCLEFGTCLGVSAMYQAAALAMNGIGHLITMEGSESLAKIAQKNFNDLKYNNITALAGRFEDVLPSVLKHFEIFDYVFIDGHHERHATIRYFEKLLPVLTHNAVVVFDDIHWSGGMKEAWKKIISHPRVKYSVDLYQLGIVIVS